MEHQVETFSPSAFKSLAFSDKVRKCVERARVEDIRFDPMPFGELVQWLPKARQTLTLASDATIEAVMKRNHEVVRKVSKTCEGGLPETIGFFAYLPLNEEGYQSLANGEFNGLNPRLDDICLPSQQPAAIYLWLVYLPGGLGQSLAVIGEAFDRLVPAGCAVFSRAVNRHAERLNREMGFLDATTIFPDCAKGLLVIFPQREPLKQPPEKKASITVARTWEDMAQVMAVRSATYLAEQHCRFEEEFDGNDFCATHLLARMNNDVAGCVRMRFFADFAKIERLAVRAEYRNSKTAYALARYAVEHCKAKGYRRIYGHSRLDLVRFWRCFGFKERAGREDFAFANVRYREMILEVDSPAPAVSLASDPIVLIRPEGAWDRPGPLDPPAMAGDRSVLDMMARDMRTVRRAKIVA